MEGVFDGGSCIDEGSWMGSGNWITDEGSSMGGGSWIRDEGNTGDNLLSFELGLRGSPNPLAHQIP